MNPTPRQQTNGQPRPAPAPQTTALQKAPPPKSIEELLSRESMLAQIKKALPKHMTEARMARIALTEVRKNPELAACDVMSFAGAIIQCAQLGLEPGSGLGHAYLIPFNNRRRGIKEVQFIPGYRGLVDLARRSGRITSFQAFSVHDGDFFDYGVENCRPVLSWRPKGPRDPKTLLYVFAIATFKDGEPQPAVMSREEVEAIRDMGNGNPVWKTHFIEMAKKTVVRRLCKMLPQSPEMQNMVDAVEAEDLVDADVGQENWRAIDADYEPVAPEHDAQKINEIRDAADTPAQPVQDAERLAAIKQFETQCARVTGLGADPEDICRRSVATVLSGPTPMIAAAASVLKLWQPAGQKPSPLRRPQPQAPADDEPPMYEP